MLVDVVDNLLNDIRLSNRVTMSNPLRDRKEGSVARKRARQFNRFAFNVAQDILLAMETIGVSKSELARRLSKHKSFVTRLLSGDQNMTLRTLSDIAFILEIEPRIYFPPVSVQTLTTVEVGQAAPQSLATATNAWPKAA